MKSIAKSLLGLLIAGLLSQSAYAGFQSSDSPSYSTPGGRTSLGTFSASETIRVTATIAPLFDLTIEPVDRHDSLNFGAVREGESPEEKFIEIKMRTNLKRQYQIVQEAFGSLKNDRGDVIPEDKFTCVTFGETKRETGGVLGAVTPTPVTEEPLVLFLSNEVGDQDSFNVGYQVTPETGQPYGEYKTVLIFTATLL